MPSGQLQTLAIGRFQGNVPSIDFIAISPTRWEPRRKIGGSDFDPLHPQRVRSLGLGLPSLAISRLDPRGLGEKRSGNIAGADRDP